MKRNVFVGILMVEAVFCALLFLAKAAFAEVFSAAMAFPFEQIGLGLRTLSLSGGSGNIAAIVLYVGISLLPVAALYILWKRRKLNAEDALLGVLSAALFIVLYLMINPGMIPTAPGGVLGQPVGKAVLGSTVYSILCGYFVLRILRIFSAGGTRKLERYMTVMLSLLNILFVYLAFGVCFGNLLDSISSLQAGNMGNEQLLGVSYVFLIVQFIVNALPYVLDVLVVFAALRLLEEMRKDRYSAQTVAAAERMSRLCAGILAATVLSNIGFNLLQLLFAKSLMILNSSVQIPVLSIVFVLAALLLTRFAAENKQLKDDNDMFI